jgi:hypothetical protein
MEIYRNKMIKFQKNITLKVIAAPPAGFYIFNCPRRFKRILTTLCLTALLISTGVCWSADFQKGADTYDRGDYATALKEWTSFAEQGKEWAKQWAERTAH